jgi:hypothetical protein
MRSSRKQVLCPQISGNKRTIMKDRTKEMGPGLLKKILTNLGMKKEDLE